jgi:type II secretion system protein N
MRSERFQFFLRWGGYLALAFFSFLFFLYQTFPYRKLFDAVTAPVQRQAQIRIQMRDLSPSMLTGVEITELNIQRGVPKGIAEIQIARFWARVSLFPLLWGQVSASMRMEMANGEATAFFKRTRNNEIGLTANLEGIELALLGPSTSKMLKDKLAKPLLEILFAPVFGRLQGSIELDLFPYAAAKDTKQTKGARPSFQRRGVFDMTKSVGRLKLLMQNTSMGPGYFPAGQMGELPVPRLRLGTVNLQVKIDKGIAEITTARAFGGDIDLKIEGKLQLQDPFPYSIFRGKIFIKLEKTFVDSVKDPLLKAGLSALPAPKQDGYSHFSVFLPFSGRSPDIKPL